MYRLLAIDIDGTLVNSRDELTPATRAALERAGAAGIHVVLATGRRYSHALPIVRQLESDVPLITASGALVKSPIDHRTLYQAQFEPQVLRDVVKTVDRAGFDPVLCGDTFAEGFDFYHAPNAARTPELIYYFAKNPGRARVWETLLTEPPPGIFGGFVVGTLEQMQDLEMLLREKMPGKLHTHVLHPPRYKGFFVEISPAGVTKWSAVKRLAAQWGIAESEICAVGDDVNDIPMILAAGLGVAMGNAQPSVKAAADRIAPTHDEDGIVQVVEWAMEGR